MHFIIKIMYKFVLLSFFPDFANAHFIKVYILLQNIQIYNNAGKELLFEPKNDYIAKNAAKFTC